MTRNASRNTKRKKQKSSTELLEFVQDFIPVRSIHHGIIETTDNRYIKILEIEPINFMLRSEEEQFNIISSFASWLKISPQHLQFKSITRKADSDRHVRLLRQDLEGETNEECRRQAEGYIRFVRDVDNREALTRRFFLIYQYEEQRRGDSEDFGLVYSTIQTVEQNARAYFMQCGNTIVQHKDPDQATAEILYMFFNRRSCVEEPFESRVNRVVVDSMAARNLVIGVDAVPNIRINHFISPRGVDFTHNSYIIMDGLYYVWDTVKADRTKKKAIMIDEIWQLIGANSNRMAAEFCLTIFKTIRGFGGAAISATQDLSDFFGLEDGKYGRAIINNSKNKIILNLEPDEAKTVQEVLKLTKTELRSITQFERGEALICSNNNKVPVVIKASKEEQEMITTDRAELEAILKEKSSSPSISGRDQKLI